MASSLAPLRRAAGWIRVEWKLFVLLVGIGALPGLLGVALLAPEDRRATGLIGGLIGLYLQLFLTARVLDDAGVMPPGYSRTMATEARFPSAFLASLLSIVGVAVGLVLLVVPGVLLYALWSLWMPAMLAERLRATAAMRRSWRLVRPHLGWISLSALWIVLAPLAATATLVFVLVLAGGSEVLVDAMAEPMAIAIQLLWAAGYASAYAIRRSEAEAVGRA